MELLFLEAVVVADLERQWKCNTLELQSVRRAAADPDMTANRKIDCDFQPTGHNTNQRQIYDISTIMNAFPSSIHRHERHRI